LPAHSVWGNPTASQALPQATATPNITGLTLSGITGATRCLHVDTSGVVSGTGADCGTSSIPALVSTHLFVGNGSNIATDFGALATFASTGGLTIAPTSGTVLTLTGPPSTLARALDISQSFAGTGSTTQLNNIAISDSANLGTGVGNGFNISHLYSGGFGSRQAFQAGFTLVGPSNASNTKHFYAAAQFGAMANTGDRGTDTTNVNSKGSIIALNPAVTLNSGATNLAEASGIQVTMFTFAGSSVAQRTGIEISDNSGAGGIQGAVLDDAIALGNIAGSAGWKCGICFDATNFASPPLAATGTAIATVGSQTFATGIDFSSATLTNFLKGPGGFLVTGSGNVGIGLVPTVKLHVQGTDTVNALVINNTAGLGTFLMRTSNTGAGIFDLNDGSGVLQVELRGDTGTTLFNGGPVSIGAGSFTGISGELGFKRVIDPNTAPGAGVLKFTVVAGTTGGSCKIVARAGTSATPVTLLDNIGSGC
jgi:hypothetical protein